MRHFSAYRRRALLLTGLACTSFAAQAQMGIGTTEPHPKAALDISAADKGLLIPRLDSAQRAGIASPPDGLMVFQKDGRVGLWYAFGSAWLYIPDKVRGGDNLGNHTATQNLRLGANALTGTGADLGPTTVGVGVRADGGLNLGQNSRGNVRLGFEAGQATTTGSSNVFSGTQSGRANTTGSANVFSGTLSGQANTTGNSNVFDGHQSGYSNTTGNSNVFTGAQSGSANTTGSANVFSGALSGQANTTGGGNVFAGYQSGRANTTGINNVFSGNQSGWSNTTGNNNVFSGAFSGVGSVSGNDNVFTGFRSGVNNTSGSNNVFSGSQSGSNNSAGSGNVFVGYQSGLANTAGSANVFSGTQSGTANTTGDNNTFSGHQSGQANTTGTNNVFTGYQNGRANTSGYLNAFSGYQSGRDNTVGFNNAFSGAQAGLLNTTGSNNAFSGYQAGVNTTTGGNNTFSGALAGANNIGGTNNTALGYNAGAATINLTNTTALGYNAQVTASNVLVLGGTGADAVNVGIGTTAPSFRLQVSGGNTRLAATGAEQSVFGLDRIVGLNDLRFFTDDAGLTQRMHIDGNGNVGIGTTASTFRLQVSGGDTRLAATGAEQSVFGLDRIVGLNDLRFFTDDAGTTQRMHIDGNGRVGIGTTTPRGKFDVDGGGDVYLVDDPNSGTGQSTYLPGFLYLAPSSGTSGTAFVQARVPNPTPATDIGLTLRTTGGGVSRNAVVIAPSGDVTVPGQMVMGWSLVQDDQTLSGGDRYRVTLTCPAGMRVLGGGGGHRDDNSAARDITVNYSGPDPNSPNNKWRVIMTNTGSASRAVRAYCTCARMQ